MHRAAIESMFGLVQRGDEIEFRPCLPAEWDDAEIVLRRDGKTLRVLFSRSVAAVTPAAPDVEALQPGERLRWSALAAEVTCRIMLPPPSRPVDAPSAEAEAASAAGAAEALRP